MVRVNIDILGISELKWTKMGEFNSDDNYIYNCGQESLRRNGVALIVNKRVVNAILRRNLKMTEWSLHFQGKPFIITVIQVYATTSNAEEAEVEWFYRSSRPIRLSRTNTQKRCPFHHRGLECKSKKSRATWSNRQIWPWSTKWSRAKANRVLSRECTGHSKHPVPTTQEMTLHMDITRWSIPKIKLTIFFVAKDDEALYSQQKQNQEQTVAQIINLLQDSNLNWRMYGKPLGHLGMT